MYTKISLHSKYLVLILSAIVLLSACGTAKDQTLTQSASSNLSSDAIDENVFVLDAPVEADLIPSEDGTEYVASMQLTFTKNPDSEAYALYPSLEGYEDAMADEVRYVLMALTKEEVESDQDKVRENILHNINDLFGDELFINVEITDFKIAPKS